MSIGERLGRTIPALAWALLPAFAFEVLFVASLGALLAPGYWLLVGLLAAGAACVLAFLAAMTSAMAVRLALGLWTGLHLAVLQAPWSGLLALPLVALGLSAIPRVEERPREAGLVVALGLGFALAVWPRASREVGFLPEVAGPSVALLAVPALGVAMGLCLQAVGRWAPRLGPLPATLGFATILGLGLLPRVEGPKVSPWAAMEDGVRGAGPNVVLLILDTVRADHLSIYGYERETTPAMAAFLRETPRARLYDLAFAPGTWTLPAHASLFTGRLPSEHGIHAKSMFTDSGIVDRALPASLRTLAEELRQRGYATGCFFANTWLQHVSGLERGFDVFLRPAGHIPLPLLGEGIRRRWLSGFAVKEGAGLLPASGLNRYALDFMEHCRPGPCFAVVNYMDAHAPYLPARTQAGSFGPVEAADGSGPPKQLEHEPNRIRRLEMRYDEEILGLDAALGQLLEAMILSGLLEDTWVFVTSDHGEAFGEHGVTEHGTTVYSEVTRVPLLIVPPVGETLPAHASAVDLLDVAATIAAIAGAERFGRGEDLRRPNARSIHVEFPGDPRKAKTHGELAGKAAQAIVRGHHKLVVNSEGRELYDLRADPRELRDLGGRQGSVVEGLSREARDGSWMSEKQSSGPERQLSDQEREQLRALGYID